MKMAIILIALLLPFFLQSVLANVGIPVMIWGDNDILAELPTKPLAGHTLSSKYFSEQLGKVGVPDVAIVFQQDEFSTEDFLRFGETIDQDGAFKNIKKFMNEESSVYLPSVKAPVNTLQSLRNKFSTVMELSNTDEAVKYMMNVELVKTTLYIIHLADTGSDENIGKAISGNDKIIGDIMTHVKDNGLTYMAVFTGKSHRKMQEIVMQASGRHLLALGESENSTITGNVTNCVILYAENIKIDNDTWTNDGIDITCTQINKTATIDITKKGSVGGTITFKAIQAYGYWVVSEVKYDDKVTPLQTKEAVEFKAPLKMSYNCGVKRVYGDNSTVNVTIGRIQLQVFESAKPGVFDSPYDCVGFFTLPVWTGLLTGLFLIAVTIAGIVMLGNINTFDLMDDPKAPPLTINVSE